VLVLRQRKVVPERAALARQDRIFEKQHMGEPARSDADHFRAVFEPAMCQRQNRSVAARLDLEHDLRILPPAEGEEMRRFDFGNPSRLAMAAAMGRIARRNVFEGRQFVEIPDEIDEPVFAQIHLAGRPPVAAPQAVCQPGPNLFRARRIGALEPDYARARGRRKPRQGLVMGRRRACHA
jgi:hypothetical protein